MVYDKDVPYTLKVVSYFVLPYHHAIHNPFKVCTIEELLSKYFEKHVPAHDRVPVKYRTLYVCGRTLGTTVGRIFLK